MQIHTWVSASHDSCSAIQGFSLEDKLYTKCRNKLKTTICTNVTILKHFFVAYTTLKSNMKSEYFYTITALDIQRLIKKMLMFKSALCNFLCNKDFTNTSSTKVTIIHDKCWRS